MAVADGDTISVLRDGRSVRVRLEGIDCPEKGQDFSQRAKQFTSDLTFGKEVTVDVRDVDRYGRLVARVHVDGKDVSVDLVEAGLAWHYTRYSRDPELAKAERAGRLAKRGLRSLANPLPPWEFRREKHLRRKVGDSPFLVEGRANDPRALWTRRKTTSYSSGPGLRDGVLSRTFIAKLIVAA